MNDVERRFHETWLGMVQPVEGLVVSIPALLDAQCFERHQASIQHTLIEYLNENHDAVPDLQEFLAGVFDLTPELFDGEDELPEELSLWVPEGHQLLRPTMGLRHLDAGELTEGLEEVSSPATKVGERYVMLVWDLPEGLPLDKPETKTGGWHYPPTAKFERLLRHCRVPIGLITNRREFRLTYAPHGESSGSITFRIADMASVGGRPILDAFLMLLSAQRFFGVAEERQLPNILRESRNRQADVTNALAGQVFEGLEILLAGFEAAADRDPRFRAQLDDALRVEDDHLYGGLLTVMLRLVFLLYSEDRGLVPVENNLYAEHLSVLGLFGQLQHDAGEYPDTMSRRFGAWPRLLATFRAVFLGADYPGLHMPPRRGHLFNPEVYPFLEGWARAGGAPIKLAEERARVRTPPVDDRTVYKVLQKLLILDGQRLSYQELSVEQIGSVYENLMGYHVVRVPGDAVKTKAAGVWVSAEEILAEPKKRRKAWLKDEAGMSNSHAKTLAAAINKIENDKAAVLEELCGYAKTKTKRAPNGSLVLQPGEERRRTSSHYTPRSLTQSIVERTLQPLLDTMGDEPSSEQLLLLKICDPAMGSGAFLVEACRFLADRVVAAWTREGVLEEIAAGVDDVVNHARRLVAQKCLYGVDKNAFAVDLAKLSMWLITLAKDEPFTFLDHALRHGDSLVGLSLKQLRGFHWKPKKQLTLCAQEIETTINQSVELRQQILALADEHGPEVTREKEWLLQSAEDALERARLIGDLVVGAFFAKSKKGERNKEVARRLGLVEEWLLDGGSPPTELLELQAQVRSLHPTFHWMLEFPEVFYASRPDPLGGGNANEAAFMDALIGNPPFLGGKGISTTFGNSYRDWLYELHPGTGANCDLVAHFFRRADQLLGAHGTMGLIATNTISEGDTREGALQFLLKQGSVILNATDSIPWPGSAAVVISVVIMARGKASENQEIRLDGELVPVVNSMLRPTPERADPVKLKANTPLFSQGSKIYGQGFILETEEFNELVAADSKNAERIFPYIGGKEVNQSPTHDFERYVISFHGMSLTEAEDWPSLLKIVRERVKPERNRLTGTNSSARALQKNWWRYQAHRPELYEALKGMERCLVTAEVAPHLCFSFQPTNRVLSHKLYVFVMEKYLYFSIMQSRIHEPWVWLMASTRGSGLNYSASRCFETFPLPPADALGESNALEVAGKALYEARAEYMVATDQGLTDTYNLLKDPTCDDPGIVELRRLHEEVDKVVLVAYGWENISVPPYGTPSTPEEEKALQTFEDEVIDRLFVLNSERAEEERLKGRTSKKKPAQATNKQTSLLDSQ